MAEIAISGSVVLVEVALHLLRTSKFEHFGLEIEKFNKMLGRMMAVIKDMEIKKMSNEQKDKVKYLRDVAYDIEDILDEYMRYKQYQSHPDMYARVGYIVKGYSKEYFHIKSLIRKVQRKIKQNKELDNDTIVSHGGSTPPVSHSGMIHSKILEEDEIVGFKGPLEELCDRLLHDGEQKSLVTISVVGGGGYGKTVLVNNIYRRKEVRKRFHCHAWVHVPQHFAVAAVWGNVLKQLSGKKLIDPSQHDDDVQEKLGNYMKTRKCLIVLDNIWSEEQWTSIQTAFPEKSPGSRIIVTTRHKAVATTCAESDRYILELAAFSSKDAWVLFCKKAFRKTNGGECHQTVKEWAKEIVNICESPLEIVVIAGLLSQTKLLYNEWKKVYEDLGSKIRSHPVLTNILEPSYKDLSSNLKKCLLYFTNFPDNHQIGSRRLCRLWVGERFAVESSQKSAQDVADEYLKELIERNLVSVARNDSGGKVRCCRVSRFLLEIIRVKAKGENFSSVARGNEDTNFHENVRRLSIHDRSLSVLEEHTNLSGIRSLLTFNLKPSSEGLAVLSKFRYMKVLDLQGLAAEEIPKSIFELTLLTYLSLRNSDVKAVGDGIKKLTYLETLDLRGTKVIELPAKIERLVHLRHLFVYRYNVKFSVAFDSVIGVTVPDGIWALVKLQKLSVIHLDEHGKIIKALKNLKHLKKLSVLKLKEKDGVDFCNSIRNMKDLLTLNISSTTENEYLDLEGLTTEHISLERLHLNGRLKKVPHWIPKLDNLFKIILTWSRILAYDPLKDLQDLPNLVELTMVDTYRSPKLVFEAGKFKKLNMLYIGQFSDLEEVIIGKGAMPELRKLTFSRCEKMKTLPLGISNLAFVENLQFFEMPKEFIAHVKSHKGKKIVNHIPFVYSYTAVSELNIDYWSREILS